jgi:hypothetical protein
MARRHRRASGRRLLPGIFTLLLGAGIACGDFTGPIPTAEEVKVRVDVVEVVVWRSEFGSYNIMVPLTIINGSPRSLYYNGFCFSELERAEGSDWVGVGPFHCDTTKRTLSLIPADTSAKFGIGRGAGGPEPIVPDFAKPGTYRLRIRLYLDSRGKIPLPQEVGISNSFTIVSN